MSESHALSGPVSLADDLILPRSSWAPAIKILHAKGTVIGWKQPGVRPGPPPPTCPQQLFPSFHPLPLPFSLVPDALVSPPDGHPYPHSLA